MPTRGKTPRDEFDHHEMESRSSVDQHKNQKGGNKMKRRIEMSEIPIGIAASALGAVVDTIDLQRFKPNTTSLTLHAEEVSLFVCTTTTAIRPNAVLQYPPQTPATLPSPTRCLP
jgi:hypothetical protein